MLTIAGKLYAQDICDTCSIYSPPLVYYCKKPNPTLAFEEIKNHLAFSSSLRSPLLFPRCVALDSNFYVLELDTDCIQKLLIPDFAPKYIFYYWNEKEKCFLGVKKVNWQSRSYSSTAAPKSTSVIGAVTPCANNTKKAEIQPISSKESVIVSVDTVNNCCSVLAHAKIFSTVKFELITIFGETLKTLFFQERAVYATFEVKDLPTGMYL